MSDIFTNIVPQDKLQEQSLKTLDIIAESLATSFGPYGSSTQIKKKESLPQFTKDGFTILKSILFNGVLEISIKEVLEDLTKHVVKEVGDGTTSAILLSNLVYKRYATTNEPNLYTSGDGVYDFKRIPPVEVERNIRRLIKETTDIILSNATEVKTKEDIRKIALISTNNDEDMSNLIADIFEKSGNEVYIDVKRSTIDQDYIKILDGMTLTTGYADKAFINNKEAGTCDINSPRIYFFEDPIDTPEMISFLKDILMHNIVSPEDRTMIPTVVLCPKVSNDVSTIMDPLIKNIYEMRSQGVDVPFLFAPNITQKEILFDLANLCGAKTFRKYINPLQQVEDQESGEAPTTETAHEFYGTADLVVSDFTKTKVVNPKLMYKEGTTEFSEYYNAIVDHLETQLKSAKEEGKDVNVIGGLRRRLHSLKANMIDLFIGGATPEERDHRYDAAEDAVLNCMSAAQNGYGFGANFQGLLALKCVVDNADPNKDKVYFTTAQLFYNAYLDLIAKLYASAFNESPLCYRSASEEVNIQIQRSLMNSTPINLRTGETDGLVLSSIRSDIVVLEIVGKVIGMLVTNKQFLCPTSQHNIYFQK